MAFVDLKWNQGVDNMGGLVGDVFFCPTEDIATLPALATDKISLTGNIVCKTGKKFIQIYHTKGTGKLDDTSVGERDGKSRENMLEFFFPGAKKEVEAFKHQVQNTPGVVICKDTENNLRVLGICVLGGNVGLDLPAYMESSSGTTGAASADRRGSTFQFKSESPHPPLFYGGDIPLTDAV